MLHFVASVDENVTLQEPVSYWNACSSYHTQRAPGDVSPSRRDMSEVKYCLDCQSHPLTPFTTAPCELPPLL